MRLALAFVFVASGAFAQDQIDPRAVTYLHRSIADWPITSSLSRVDLSNGICFPHTKAGQWPQSALGEPGQEIQIEGNPWVFAQIGGRWYGATWDWLRPGQTCKGERVEDLGAHQIRIPPMDGNWIPNQATPLCWAVSTRARDGVLAGQERSNIVCTPNAQVPTNPAPVPQPIPQPPALDLSNVLAHVQDVQNKLVVLQGTASATHQEVLRAREEQWGWGKFFTFVGKYIAPVIGGVIAGWQLTPEDQ
jgi:hypothetical protein